MQHHTFSVTGPTTLNNHPSELHAPLAGDCAEVCRRLYRVPTAYWNLSAYLKCTGILKVHWNVLELLKCTGICTGITKCDTEAQNPSFVAS